MSAPTVALEAAPSGRGVCLEAEHTRTQGLRAGHAGSPSSDGTAVAAPETTRRNLLLDSVKLHVAVYLPVNLLLVGVWAAAGSRYFWPVWAILGWGFLVVLHAAPLLARRGRVGQARAARRTAERRRGAAMAPDGTVTILFSDIESSAAANERLGDIRWLELLRDHHAIVREQVDAHGGYEVKTQGDGFMVAFGGAHRAIHCARAIQLAIDARLGHHRDGPLRVRIGLHTGDAITDEADFYGRNVVLAARITDHAAGGEIVASEVVKQLADSAGDVRFENERKLELNGLAGTHTVFSVT